MATQIRGRKRLLENVEEDVSDGIAIDGKKNEK